MCCSVPVADRVRVIVCCGSCDLLEYSRECLPHRATNVFSYDVVFLRARLPHDAYSTHSLLLEIHKTNRGSWRVANERGSSNPRFSGAHEAHYAYRAQSKLWGADFQPRNQPWKQLVVSLQIFSTPRIITNLRCI